MQVLELKIIQFKNHTEQKFQFSSEINCFVGNNGVGKTNILEALYYTSVGKSFLGVSDYMNIQEGNDFFTIDSEIVHNDKNDILKILVQKDHKKIIKKNDKSYEKLADHIGYLPSVMISPYDSNLISEGSENRRKFLDAMISQTDPEYLHHLVQYHKTIQQRNALLKYFAKNRTFDADSLEIYQHPLKDFGDKIYNRRREFVTAILPSIQQFYEIISSGKEKISVQYESHLQNENMEEILTKNLSKDRQLTYTSEGVHKDDLVFILNNHLMRKYASQGQQKSFLIALKLAQIKRIKEITNKSPIVLLDDIFDKLDDQRVAQLIELINQQQFGQIFLTDTHRERTENVVKNISKNSKIFEIRH